MKKRMWGYFLTAFVLVLLTSCGGKTEGETEPTGIETPGSNLVAESESPDIPHTLKPDAEPTPVESEQPEETVLPVVVRGEPVVHPWGDTPPETEAERRMAVFQAVMEQFLKEGFFPDGTPVDFSAEERSKNQFTVWDVDGDEREELVVLLTTTKTLAGHTALIYSYTDERGIVIELEDYPRLTFYRGGVIQAGWPLDLSSGGDVMWPYTLYKYDYSSGVYKEAGSAKARTKALEGVKFPAEADEDGDGIVYCLDMDYEHPVDGAEYEAWRESIVRSRAEMEVPFYNWTEENIAAISDLAMSKERAKVLIEQANAALAPFLGEGAVECDQEDWLLLEGYSAQAELLEGLKEPFTNWLAEQFYESYAPLILKEEEGKVYVRSNSRDIIGHYYDMDLDTISDIRENAGFLFSDYAFTVEGSGNKNPMEWEIGISKEGWGYKIGAYLCHETEYDNDAAHTAILDGIPYTTRSDMGSPTWLGEPERVEIQEEVYDGSTRWEYYPGVTVELQDWSVWWTDVPGHHPAQIWITAPGIPTSRGVEVGMTMKEVLTAYPQFDMEGADVERLVYTRCYPWWKGEYSGDAVYFYFDENFVLTEIFYYFSISM